MKFLNNVIPYITLILILISILYGISLSSTTTTMYVSKMNIENKLKEIPFFKKENLSRYISYYNKNKSLTTKQIITDVNIGLDKPYYTDVKKSSKLNSTQILVNKYISLPEDYVPNNLEPLNEKYAINGMKLTKEAKKAFEDMSEDASKENLKIIAMSTYRSYTYQNILYNKYKKQDGQEEADKYSARPGHSEHQTGLAVDIYNQTTSYTEFEKTKEFTWMQENAYKYGFILRYPKDKIKQTGYQYESWHYRYVGAEIAEYIHKNNITYDEYYIQKLDKKKE